MNEEPIFARIGPQSHRRRYLTKRDIVSPLKAAAVELGLDPTLYSARSMRVTYASVATAAAVPMAEINRVGWSSQSNIAKTVYSRAIETRNTSAVMKSNALSLSLVVHRAAHWGNGRDLRLLVYEPRCVVALARGGGHSHLSTHRVCCCHQ